MRTFASCAIVALVVAGASLEARGEPAAAAHVRVAQGELGGVRQGEVSAFLGVPYAAAPVGANRWRAPQEPVRWRGLRKADAFGASCAQGLTPDGFGPWTAEYVVQGEVSEDCLFLNIWTQAKAGQRRPVLVWIHGGGFTEGSGSVAVYNGRALARRGIVVVTINYRLGAFGFLAHPELTAEAGKQAPANWGLQDQVAALKWVRQNIAAFGGDPKSVTIAGQSAGSMAVHALLVSPTSKGLFRRAISQSGLPSTAPPLSLAKAEQQGLAYQKALGVSSLAALRAMPADQLLKAAKRAPRFSPVLDGIVLPEPPAALVQQGRFHDVPLIIGQVASEISTNSGKTELDEPAYHRTLSGFFGPSADEFAPLYPAMSGAERIAAAWQMQRDLGRMAIYRWAKLQCDHGKAPVYAYYYDHVEPGPEAAKWGAFHTSEVPYVFDTLEAAPQRGFTALDRAVALDVSSRWLNFIRTGDPNDAGHVHWPRFDPEEPKIMDLGDRVGGQPFLPPAKFEAMKRFIAKGGEPRIF